MRSLRHTLGGVLVALILLIGACSNDNKAPSLSDSLGPDDGFSQSPSAEYILAEFTKLARQGELDALSLAFQDVFAAGRFDELVDALSVVLNSDRVDELAEILNAIIDRGTIFEFTPIASDILVTLAADRDPAKPGVQSSFDVMSQLFETGALRELIVPLRNLLAPEFPQDSPFIADPRIEVVGIILDLIEALGSQRLQDILDQTNLALIPFSEVLPPRQAFLLRGRNASIATFTAVNNTQVVDPDVTPEVADLTSPDSTFRINGLNLLPQFPNTPDPVLACTPDSSPTSPYHRAYKIRFTSGLNFGRTYNVISVNSATQLSICDTAYDLGGAAQGPALQDDAFFRFEVLAAVPQRNSLGAIVRHTLIAVGAALHSQHTPAMDTNDFVTGEILSGDDVNLLSGVNAGLTFGVAVNADDTLSPTSELYGDLLYLGTFARSGETYRGRDLSASTLYYIGDRNDTYLAFKLSELDLVRDVLPILQRIVSGRATEDSETLVELMFLIDLVPGAELQGDDFVNTLETVLLASVRNDTNRDGLYDAVDNLDRNGDGGCRNAQLDYDFWTEGQSTACAHDFIDVNNDGVVQNNETFDVNADGIFDSADFARSTLLNTANCSRAQLFDRENIATLGPGACPPGDGFVDCNLFAQPLNCRVFDTNNDGRLDDEDLIPSVVDRNGRVGILGGFSISDRFPDGASDGRIDWRDIMNSRSITSSDFAVPSSANPLTMNDSLPRFGSALGNTILDLFQNEAGASVRRGAEALIFALDNPANLFIDGRSLPGVLLQDAGRLLTTRNELTDEFIAGPLLETGYAMMTNGPKSYDGLTGAYEPRYLPELLNGVVRAKFAQKGSTAHAALAQVRTLLEPITSVGGVAGLKDFPYGTFELLVKHGVGELACSQPFIAPDECLAAASPSNRLISAVERAPTSNINQSFIRHITADDERPLDPADPLPQATPEQAAATASPTELDFLNLVVNNTSGGAIDNVVRFPGADLRQAVPGDFLIFSTATASEPLRPLYTAVCGDPLDALDPFNPSLLARGSEPQLDLQGLPTQPLSFLCDQFQTFDLQINPVGLAVEANVAVRSVADNTDYTVTVNGTDYVVNSGAGAGAASISAALAAAIDSDPGVIATDQGGSVFLEPEVVDTFFTVVAGGRLEIFGKFYADAVIDIDVYDPLAVSAIASNDELKAVCAQTDLVCLRILQVLDRETALVGLDSEFEDDANANDIADDDLAETGMPVAVDPTNLWPLIDRSGAGGDRYYGVLANHLTRLPRVAFIIYQYHQVDGQVPTFDGLGPNFDLSNIDNDLALANTAPDFRPSIGQQATLGLPVLDIEHELSLIHGTDLFALDLVTMFFNAGFTATEAQNRAVAVCPSGSVPVLSCSENFVNNPYRKVNEGLPDDRIAIYDPAPSTLPKQDIASVYDDRILCVDGSLPSSGLSDALSSGLGELNQGAWLNGFDPFGFWVVPPDVTESDQTICECIRNPGFGMCPAVVTPDICVAGAGNCNGEFHIVRVANVLARLLPLVAGINPRTAERLIEDTEVLTGNLLTSGQITQTDREALEETLDAVNAIARLGITETAVRLAGLLARPNVQNVDVQTSVIEVARLLTDTQQLDNGEVANNRVVLRGIEPVIAAIFNPDTRFGEDLIELLLALESIPAEGIENHVLVSRPGLGLPCDPSIPSPSKCENRNNGPDLTADFLRAVTTPTALKSEDGIVRHDIDGNEILVRPIDSLMVSMDDLLTLGVDCVTGVDAQGNGTPVFNCSSLNDPVHLTPFGEITRDVTVILGEVLASPEFSTELVPFFTSIFETVVELLEPERGNRRENPALSAFRLYLRDSSLEAVQGLTDAFESLNQADRSKLLRFVSDQFDPDTGAVAGVIEAIDPIVRNDPSGIFATAISDQLTENPTLPNIRCSGSRSIAGRLVDCITKVLADIPEEDIRFVFDTYVELVDTGSAEALVNIASQLVTTGALEDLTPTLLLLSQEGVLDEFIIFNAILLENGVVGLEQ